MSTTSTAPAPTALNNGGWDSTRWTQQMGLNGYDSRLVCVSSPNLVGWYILFN